MLRHIFTIIYNQRKQNIFIFLELLLVACLLWAISDSLCVDIYTEKQPMGVDVESVYELHLSVANEAALEDSSGYRRVAEDFLKLVDNVRQCRRWKPRAFRYLPYLIRGLPTGLT